MTAAPFLLRSGGARRQLTSKLGSCDQSWFKVAHDPLEQTPLQQRSPPEHVWPPSAHRACIPVPSGPPVATKAASLARAGESTDPGCAAELETCRRMSSRLALGLWEGAWKKAPAADAGAPVPLASVDVGVRVSAASKTSDPQVALCRIARDALRDKWLATRDEVTEAVVHGLTEAAFREDAERDGARAADALGLEGRTRRTFEEDFAALREKRMSDLEGAIQATPVDWAQMLVVARSLFDAEDALVGQEIGAEASQQYRDSQNDVRITVLTAMATYADVDWDDAVVGPQK